MRRLSSRVGSQSRLATPVVVRGSAQRAFSATCRVLTSSVAAPPPPPPPPPTRPSAVAPPPPPPAAPPVPQPVSNGPPPPQPPLAATASDTNANTTAAQTPPPKPTVTPSAATTPPPPPPPPPLPAPTASKAKPPRQKPATSQPQGTKPAAQPRRPSRSPPRSTSPKAAVSRRKQNTANTTNAQAATPGASRRRSAPSPPTAPSAPSAPPPPPPPPPPPVPSSGTPAGIYTIAPPKTNAHAEATTTTSATGREDNVGGVLPASFASAVEAVVLHARDTIPTRRPKPQPDPVDGKTEQVNDEARAADTVAEEDAVNEPTDATPPTACNVVAEAEVVSEEASAATAADATAVEEDVPTPLAAELAASLDRHEIPSQMGGDDDEAVAAAPGHDEDAELPPSLGVVEEVKPFTVWRGVREPAASPDITTATTATYVRLVTRRGTAADGRSSHVATLQLMERPPTMPALLGELMHKLDDIVAWATKEQQQHQQSAASDGTTASSFTCAVRLVSSPHLPFFAAAQHPLELSASELEACCEQRDALLQRMYHPAVPGLTFEADAAGSVVDFAAELFFACSTRTLSSPKVENAVGFPSLSLGLFPSFYTVNRLRQLQGVLFTVENVPKLHEYDASSFAAAGLVTVPAASSQAADKKGAPTEEGALLQMMSAPRAAPGWGAWLEDYAMSRLCRSSSQRDTVMQWLLLPRGFTYQRHGLEGVFSVMPAWREYAVRVAHHCDGGAAAARLCRGFCEQVRGGSRRTNTGSGSSSSSSSAPSQPPTCVSRCNSRRLLRHAAATQRRLVAPLSSPLFVTFRPDEVAQWSHKVKALTEALPAATTDNSNDGGGEGATVVLDVSAHAMPETLELLETLKTASFRRAQSTRLLLLGDADTAAQAILKEAPCAAVISSVSPFAVTPFTASLQQVRLFTHSGWPADLQHDTLAAATTYLQHLSAPYVLCATPALQRLVVTYVAEAMRMTAAAVPEDRLERAAVTELGLFCSPATLLSIYGGPAAMLAMLQAIRRSGVAPRVNVTDGAAAAEAALRDMIAASCGAASETCATTFSRGAPHKRAEKGSTDSSRPTAPAAASLQSSVSDAEVAQRLLAVVVNCLCELLDEGSLLSVNDANLLSVAALGFSENTGGALALADHMGLDTMIGEMTQLAARHGSALAPHPLLVRMARDKHSFASVAAEAEAE